MKKEDILKAIKNSREKSKKRNFSQTFDFVINFKKLNLKNPEHNLNEFVVLKYSKGKKSKICGLVDKELFPQAEKVFDKAVAKDVFQSLSAKEIKKLAGSYDYFVAQANIMPDIAKFFGRVFGPKGKMPSPKAGCVVPPNAELDKLNERLQKTVRVQTKNELSIKCPVGKEEMKDEEIQENIIQIYNHVLSLLPEGEANIKNVYVKLTMGKPFFVGKGVKDESS